MKKDDYKVRQLNRSFSWQNNCCLTQRKKKTSVKQGKKVNYANYEGKKLRLASYARKMQKVQSVPKARTNAIGAKRRKNGPTGVPTNATGANCVVTISGAERGKT